MTRPEPHRRHITDTRTALSVQLKQKNEAGTDTVVDLTGLTVKFKLYDSAGTVVVSETQTGVTVSDAVTGKNKSIGGKARPFTFKNPSQEFIKYRLVWKPTAIYFYYGDRLVRKVTDKTVMEQVNATEMNVVINNGITRYLDSNDQASDFIVKYFKYTPRNL